MSKFSGKCDFFDTVEIYSPKDLLNAKVYINKHRIKFEDESDLIPYYPYIIGSMASSRNEDGSASMTIHLSAESYVDQYEKQTLSNKIKNIVTFLRSNKYREKTYDEYVAHFSGHEDEVDRELFDKVLFTKFYSKPLPKEMFKEMSKIYGFINKECFGIHTPTCQLYRKELLDEALKNGYNKCYAIEAETQDDVLKFNDMFMNGEGKVSYLLTDVWRSLYELC